MTIVLATHPMLITTKRVPKTFFATQKRNKPFTIKVGRSSVDFNGDIFPFNIKDMQDVHNDLQKIGAAKCPNKIFSDKENRAVPVFCSSDPCCCLAEFLTLQKNIEAQKRSHTIKTNFLKTIEKEDKYLGEIEDSYENLIRYKILLIEFCNSNHLAEKRLELYKMIKRINLCLFAQARIIVEDSFEDWKKNNFRMTPTIKCIRYAKENINEWHTNEREYCKSIKNKELQHLYASATVGQNIATYRINRIEEEFKTNHLRN